MRAVKSKEPFYGPLFRFARWWVRLALGKHTIHQTENLREPAIYVARHQNMHGPVHCMAFMPVPVRLWTLHIFRDREACEAQYRDFTFSVRFGWPKWLAALVARLVSVPVTSCMASVGAIPVYRGQREVLKTFELSVDALIRGESLILFPDIVYDDTSDDAGAFYTGYLHLARSYRKKTGKPLAVVPVYCTQKSRKLVIGEPIMFSADAPFRAEKERVAQAVHDSLNEMAHIWEIDKSQSSVQM